MPSEEVTVELRDPYLNPFEEIVMDTGSIPCSIHGYDHLSRDPTCEFCKKALGPLYRHLSKKYGKALGDQTPTLSFDFSAHIQLPSQAHDLCCCLCGDWILSDCYGHLQLPERRRSAYDHA